MLVLRLFSFCGFVLSLALLGMGLLCFVDPHEARGYLIDIFTAPLLSVGVIAAFTLIQLRQRASALISLIAVGVLAASLWPQIAPERPVPSNQGKPVRLMFANLYIKNETPDQLMMWVAQEDPDIVAVIEAGPLTKATLAKALEAEYPYKGGRYDTLVFSRYPIRNDRFHHFHYSLMTASVDGPNGPLSLAVAHLSRPWPFDAPGMQGQKLKKLAQILAAEKPERMVLVGDFNTTPAASGLGDLKRSLNFTAAAAPVGTWPAVLPAPLRIGIDNGFAGKELTLRNRKAGPYYGSDHRPIVFEIYPVE